MNMLNLQQYQAHIRLHERFKPELESNLTAEKLVTELLELLLLEEHAPKSVTVPSRNDEKRQLLRAVLNIRAPYPLSEALIVKLDTLLQLELQQKHITKWKQLSTVREVFPQARYEQSDRFTLWQGDITTLDADAIVNAANSAMLGCFQPLHACIDNAIHSAAGPQLRADCQMIMNLQNCPEATGSAKITRGYHLPASYVLHTVGPIVPRGTELSILHQEQLASCYEACLQLAHEVESIKSIAFCAISTGVFGFPKQAAAAIALQTVNDWLSTHDHHFERIIFNVFSDEDYDIYRQLLLYQV